MEGPIKFEDPGARSFGGKARSLSPESKANYSAGTGKEALEAHMGTENSSQPIDYYSAPQSMHYDMSSIPPQPAAMAAMAAAAGSTYSLPTYASLEQHEPRLGGVDRERGGCQSPKQMKTQPSTLAEHASLPDPLYDAVDESPFLTNAKQFHRILKRRVARQGLEEARQLGSKGRKSYLQESRHDYMRKNRGRGWRFLTADEVAETERTKVENKKENEALLAAKDYEPSKSQPLQPETQSRNNQQRGPSTPDSESDMIVFDLQAQVESSNAIIPVDQGQVTICSSHAAEIGEALSDASQTNTRCRKFTRSKSLSPTRSSSSNELIVAFMPTLRGKSADTEEGTGSIRSRTRSNLGTDEEDNWSSEFEEDVTTKLSTLTRDQRNRIEQVMGTFWDVMNKNWKYYIHKETKAPGEAGSSSATKETTFQTTSRSSSLLIHSQKSLGKRPANDDERDNEERQPKRNRDDSNLSSNASEKIKYSCPYRKHNRRKYSVHTHPTCALTGFPDLARTKEHLYRKHRAPIQCHRCTLLFDDQKALKTHIKAKTICDLVEGAAVEGFELDVEEQLRRRKKSSRDQPVESRWAEIYLLLFPNDDPENIPSPFWEPPIDEPAPTSISIEDYIRQEVPRRVRQLVEDRLVAEDYPYELTLILSNQMLDIFDAQIDSCILEYRSTVGKGSQNSDLPTPPSSSVRSSVVLMEQPAAVPFSSSTSAPRSTSPAPEDWFASYLQSETSSEIPSDPLLSFPHHFSHMPLGQLSGADNMQEDFSTELYYTQSSQQTDRGT